MATAATGEKKLRVAALMLARGGSKGVPRKNITPILGVPLIAYGTRAAKDSGVFDDVWVSTEDEEIKQVALNVCKVKVFDRDPSTAQDHSKCEEAIGHFVDRHDYDIYCLVQATNPLILPLHFREGFQKLINNGHDSLLSVTRGHRFRWSDELWSKPLNYDPCDRPNRQNWPGELSENGGFYFFTKETFVKYRCRLGKEKVGTYEMPPYAYVEIDNKYDLEVMGILCQKYAYKPLIDLEHIKLAVFDVDGTLTDGTVGYDHEGNELAIFFDRRDGMGITELHRPEIGVHVAFISKSGGKAIAARAAKLGVKHVVLECSDKLSALTELCRTLNVEFNQVAYMGDDVNDLECLKKVGVAACPFDAHPSVKVMCTFVSQSPGGRGAARELCDRICESKRKLI